MTAEIIAIALIYGRMIGDVSNERERQTDRQTDTETHKQRQRDRMHSVER